MSEARRTKLEGASPILRVADLKASVRYYVGGPAFGGWRNP